MKKLRSKTPKFVGPHWVRTFKAYTEENRFSGSAWGAKATSMRDGVVDLRPTFGTSPVAGESRFSVTTLLAVEDMDAALDLPITPPFSMDTQEGRWIAACILETNRRVLRDMSMVGARKKAMGPRSHALRKFDPAVGF